MMFYDKFSVFSNSKKKLRFNQGFPKNIDLFSKFWGSKTQNFEIYRLSFCTACHFTSILVFLCGFLLNSIFGEFLNIEVIFVKIGVK